MKPSNFAIFGFLLAGLIAASSMQGQNPTEPEPKLPEIQALREPYAKNIAAIRSARDARLAEITRSYLGNLERLQHDIAAGGDLNAVAAVKAEIERVTAKREPSEEERKGMPAKLVTARRAYEREGEPFMANAARQEEEQTRTYISALEAVQRRLTTQNRIEEAGQVKAIIDQLAQDAAFARIAGTWSIKYANGTARQYVIDLKGNVTWGGAMGKVVQNGRDLLIDFNDGKIERVSRTATGLLIEHFNPKNTYPKKVDTRGIGTKG
jgi:hypothetical protein